MQKITPFLWFDDNAEEAMKFYISVFKNSKIGKVARYGKAGPGPEGTVMTAAFELEGQQFIALNAGPKFKFTEAISFVVNCETQKEVDEFWEKLSTGGEKGRCGWLKRQVRTVVANSPHRLGKDDERQRSRQIAKGHEGIASDG